MEKHECNIVQVDYWTGEEYIIATFLNTKVTI